MVIGTLCGEKTPIQMSSYLTERAMLDKISSEQFRFICQEITRDNSKADTRGQNTRTHSLYYQKR